jgi:PAS domain-containing protein
MTDSIWVRSASSTGNLVKLAPSEAEMLTKLAALVVDQMELRLAARKAGELEKTERKMAEQLHQTIEALHESEERFRDLFDEAPDGLRARGRRYPSDPG